MDLNAIVKEHLIAKEFDGLFNPDGECACSLEDFAPCEMVEVSCEEGFKAPCDCGDDHDFHIQALKSKDNGGRDAQARK